MQHLNHVAERSGWYEKYGKLPPYHGIGVGIGAMASGSKGVAKHDTSAAFVKIADDGIISLFTGIPDMGQGSHTTMAIIAASSWAEVFIILRSLLARWHILFAHKLPKSKWIPKPVW